MLEKAYQQGECYKYQLIIKHLLETPLIFAPEQQIIYRDKVRFTYRMLNERIHRLANALRLLGIKAGDTVCVFDYDSHRYLECFFAIPMMGAVLHTQNWRLSPEQILYTMNHAEDDVVLIHSDFLPILEAIKDKLTTVKKIILITDDDKKPDTKIPVDMEYEEMLRGASRHFDFPDLDENTRATTFYTTGTTGAPKGVYFSHRQLVLHTQAGLIGLSAYESPARFRSTDVYMPLTPMFHVHAWGIPYLATLLGVKQVYPGRYEPEMLVKLILTEKVTFSHCVPTILHMLVTSPVVKKIDLSKWKVIIGGSRLPKGLARATIDLGIQVFAGYGMSETCPVISLANLKPHMLDWNKENQLDKLIMTGLPIPFVYARIIDSSGKDIQHNGTATGELILRAPWLTESYFKEPERTKDLWKDGWLYTGDVASIDPAGYIQITDRTKDVIKTGGEWISSLELENLISQHDAVSEAAAIGVPDEKWGERPVLIVVLRPEYKDKVSQEDLQAFMTKFVKEGKIPKYGVPDRYLLVDAIPKTSVGKINKIQLRKLYS
ncbi:MAG: fatty acid--CoA ligase [Syntrophaceae bacterium]|nr:fatty acid--CoA ligase [Syntrophaceae bacterium]